MSAKSKLAFVSSDAPEAVEASKELTGIYGECPIEDADVIVALGGDGLMLQTLHSILSTDKTIFGMNRGSVGFLMNDYEAGGLAERIAAAEVTTIHPLKMQAVDSRGRNFHALAFNEVSLLRQIHQAAKLRISVDGKVRMDELICDGVIVATPAGSTAYNLSAHGPILPVNSPLLALTPISAFRPRRWRGAILPHQASIKIAVMEADKRPVAAVADHFEVRNVCAVSIEEDQSLSARIMFDPGHSLGERVLNEQFKY